MSNERDYVFYFNQKPPSGTIKAECSTYADKMFLIKMLKTVRKEHPEFGIGSFIVNTMERDKCEPITKEII